jgi:hypothetical protein
MVERDTVNIMISVRFTLRALIAWQSPAQILRLRYRRTPPVNKDRKEPPPGGEQTHFRPGFLFPPRGGETKADNWAPNFFLQKK